MSRSGTTRGLNVPLCPYATLLMFLFIEKQALMVIEHFKLNIESSNESL